MHSHCINGVWISGAGPSLAVINPATGAHLWRVAQATAAEVEAACSAARAAFAGWSMTPLEDRIKIIRRFRDLLKSNADELVGLISQEVGKPLWEARTEVASMAAKVDISVQAHAVRTGKTVAKVADGDAVVQHRPHGVLGVFGPYNFPGHLPNGHIVPALIAGNTLVLKPSEFAPRTAVKIVALWQQAGLPDGVLNLINGGRDTGAVLMRQSALDGILFTGSYQTGALLHRHFAGQPGKLLALEMGGNNALVVWDVADQDAAVHHAIVSAFISAGQRCTCARRLIVADSEQGVAFVHRLVEVASRLIVGAPDSVPEPFMGPVVSAVTASRLLAAQDDLNARGGRSLLAMRQLVPQTGLLSAGIIDMTDSYAIPDEEYFGPLLQVIRVKDFDAALIAANATTYDLAAGLLSDDAALWQQFLQRSRAGVVNWNRPTTGAVSTAPFGGIGHSGNHRPSAYYAADYCAYPVASIENTIVELPPQLLPGLSF